MARLTRCDVCEAELPFGQRGYHVEALDAPINMPGQNAYWDCCGLTCLANLADTLIKRDKQKGDI